MKKYALVRDLDWELDPILPLKIYDTREEAVSAMVEYKEYIKKEYGGSISHGNTVWSDDDYTGIMTDAETAWAQIVEVDC